MPCSEARPCSEAVFLTLRRGITLRLGPLTEAQRRMFLPPPAGTCRAEPAPRWSAGIWGTWGVKSCWKGKGAQGGSMGVEQIVMKFVQYSQSICSFDQGFLLKLDAAHAGSKGICYALSSCFILGCLSGKIPEDSFKIISDYNKLDTLVAIQKAYSGTSMRIGRAFPRRKGTRSMWSTRSMSLWAGQAGFLFRLYG